MQIHTNTMMVTVAMFLLSSMMTSKGVAEGANMIRQRNTRRVADEASSPIVAAAHPNQEQTAMELGMADAVEEEEKKNLELDHYFRRTLQSSMASMPDDLGYYKVKIRNDTPFNSFETVVSYGDCDDEYIQEGIKTGYTWIGPYRGGCLVTNIYAALDRPEDKGGKVLWCDDYSPLLGTGYSEFFFIYSDGKCCIHSSAQSKECP